MDPARGLLEVIALHAADAERAEAGGADRIELVGSMQHAGLSPEPALVGEVRRATTLPIRVMLRLRDGFGTDGGEATRLHGLLADYRATGADGVVLGFLNGHTDIDVGVVSELVGDAPDFGWTFHRAIDSCLEVDRNWRTLRTLPGLDQVLTAGSARGVGDGLDDLVARARSDEFARRVIMAGGGLLARARAVAGPGRHPVVPHRVVGASARLVEGVRRRRPGRQLATAGRRRGGSCYARGVLSGVTTR